MTTSSSGYSDPYMVWMLSWRHSSPFQILFSAFYDDVQSALSSLNLSESESGLGCNLKMFVIYHVYSGMYHEYTTA